MRVRFSVRSERDLVEIGDYIALDSPMRAMLFIRELRKACTRIGLMPTSYRQRPELGEGVRSAAVKSYAIFFEIAGGEVVIARFLHGARDIGAADFEGGEQPREQ